MSGHLCLKWNNHSTAFLKSIVSIQLKEKYCDATIACQGKYFPVHRVILSTCSDYFEEMFERIQCPHPYIVFKDIEPREMELLLNYMYRGEVNVIQEQLPTLIKAAEALKIKGLAVPDDLPSTKESSGKKRSLPSDEQSKRRSDERRKRRNSSELHSPSVNRNSNISRVDEEEPRIIKQEPLDYEATPLQSEFDSRVEMPNESSLPMSSETEGVNKSENEFAEFPSGGGETSFIKSEDNHPPDDAYDDQASSWSDFASSDMQNLDVPQTSQQDDIDIDIEEIPVKVELDLQSNEEYDFEFTEEFEDSEKYLVAESIKKSMKRRMNIHFIHKCSVCSYGTNNLTNLKSHIRYKHTKERPFQCSECDKRFYLKTDVGVHMRIHTGEKPFECSVCTMKFALKGNLKQHIMRKHK